VGDQYHTRSLATESCCGQSHVGHLHQVLTANVQHLQVAADGASCPGTAMYPVAMRFQAVKLKAGQCHVTLTIRSGQLCHALT
jgi:hypothetical protein